MDEEKSMSGPDEAKAPRRVLAASTRTKTATISPSTCGSSASDEGERCRTVAEILPYLGWHTEQRTRKAILIWMYEHEGKLAESRCSEGHFLPGSHESIVDMPTLLALSSLRGERLLRVLCWCSLSGLSFGGGNARAGVVMM